MSKYVASMAMMGKGMYKKQLEMARKKEEELTWVQKEVQEARKELEAARQETLEARRALQLELKEQQD